MKKIAPIRVCVAIEKETSAAIVDRRDRSRIGPAAAEPSTAETSAATAAIRDRSDMRGTECKERTEKNGII